jgi:hypothetical protein
VDDVVPGSPDPVRQIRVDRGECREQIIAGRGGTGLPGIQDGAGELLGEFLPVAGA